MLNASGVAKQAAEDITKFLMTLPSTVNVQNVEDDPNYRTLDIDLIWERSSGHKISIEIKGDRWHKTGNYFFETVSNKSKNTICPAILPAVN